MSKSIREYNQRREVPCMNDARNPPENPESNVYPNICLKVRRLSVGLLDEDVTSLPGVHPAFSENDLIM